MAEILRISKEDLVVRYYGDVERANGEMSVRLDPNRTTPCPFPGEDNACRIYPVRPFECRLYPFDIKLDLEFPRPSPFDEFIGMDCPELEDPP
jgi:Fe-S-cluster containining protein